MAYSLLSTGIDDLEDHPEYAAYLNPSSTTFEHNSNEPPRIELSVADIHRLVITTAG
jgi:hypothetical protein